MENQHLLQYIGKTKTQKISDEINRDYRERFEKQFPTFFNPLQIKTKAYSLVSVLRDNEIKGIGMSCMNDLILDNFGKIFSAFFMNTGNTISVADILSPPNTTIDIWGSNTDNIFSTQGGGAGTFIHIGSGSTPPARTDFDIESPFGSSPENSRNSSSSGFIKRAFITSAFNSCSARSWAAFFDG